MQKNIRKMSLALVLLFAFANITPANANNDYCIQFKCYEVKNEKGVASYTINAAIPGNCDLSLFALCSEDTKGDFSCFTLRVNETELKDKIIFSQCGWQEMHTKNKAITLKQGENVLTFTSANRELPQIKNIKIIDGQAELITETNPSSLLASTNRSGSSATGYQPAPRLSDKYEIPFRPGASFDVPYSYTFSLPVYLNAGESISFYAPTANDPVFGRYESTVEFNLYFFYNKPSLYSESKTSENRYIGWNIQSVPYTGVYYLLAEAKETGEKGGVTLMINGQLYRYSFVSNQSQPVRLRIEGIKPEQLGAGDNSYYNLFTINARSRDAAYETDPCLWLKKLSAENKKVIKDGKESYETTYKYVIMDYNDDNTTPSDFSWGKNARIRTLLPEEISGIPKDLSERDSMELYNVLLSASYPVTMENDTCDLYHSFWTNAPQDFYMLRYFPNLRWEDAIMSGGGVPYNCYAFTVGVNEERLLPEDSENSIEWFDRFYGNEEVASRFNKHFKRPVGSLKYTRKGATETNSVIDLWGKNQGDSIYYTHASIRRNSDGIPHGYDWESKCGEDPRIFHPRYALEGSLYGRVMAHYRIAENQDIAINPQIAMEKAIADGKLVIKKAEFTALELERLSEMKASILKEKQDQLEDLYAQWKSYYENNRIHSSLWIYTQCSEYNNLLQCLHSIPDSEYLLYDKFVQNDLLSMLPIREMALNSTKEKSMIWNEIIDTPYQEGIIRTSRYNVTLFIKSVLNGSIILQKDEKENESTSKVDIRSTSSLITVEANIEKASFCSIHLVDLKTNSVLQILPERKMKAGEYTFSHPVASGLYLVTCIIDGHIHSKKIVIP